KDLDSGCRATPDSLDLKTKTNKLKNQNIRILSDNSQRSSFSPDDLELIKNFCNKKGNPKAAFLNQIALLANPAI
ncbi:hypothetical protein N9141_01165, partial [bacterium]|nr:hypothetical protein [bacterium]